MIITEINGKFVKPKDAKVSVLSDIGRGFGIFETIRTYGNKKLFAIEKHLKRLFDSAKKISLKIDYNKQEILAMTKNVIKKSPHKIQRIKIMCISKATIIISMPFKPNSKDYKGVSVKSIQQVRTMPEIKSISYMPSFLSHELAAKQGFSEAILIDKSGEVYEGAYSNIFWFEKNMLCTRKEDILPGITREIILEISPFKIKFKKIKIKELLKKSEIFLSSSLRGIVPITKIDKTKIGTGELGPNTQKLTKIFNETVASYAA